MPPKYPELSKASGNEPKCQMVKTLQEVEIVYSIFIKLNGYSTVEYIAYLRFKL